VPHLHLAVSEPLADAAVETFTDWVTDRYAEVMDTGTGHVAVAVRDDAALSMGRADPGRPVAVLDADVRAGRDSAQRRTLAADVVAHLDERLGVPAANTYVVYTEHPGEDFHLAEGALDSWSADEGGDDPLGD
jgi:phenylpyruvate tautomerase PptA (4-oxalocrotonate tautomerase family)